MSREMMKHLWCLPRAAYFAVALCFVIFTVFTHQPGVIIPSGQPPESWQDKDKGTVSHGNRALNVGVEMPATTEPYNDPAFNFQRWFKHFQYSLLAFNSGLQILFGKAQPLILFEVLSDPPSMFLNWELRPDKMDELMVGKPTWLEMAPVQILETDIAPRYYLSLNVYEVRGLSGLLSGLRAEWSIYVRKVGQLKPSFMVIETRHTELSMDTVNGFVQGSKMIHQRSSDGSELLTDIDFNFTAQALSSSATPQPLSTFKSRLSLVLQPNSKVLPTREWITCNDLIYWSNGVADRGFYDGDAVNVPVQLVEVLEIQDSTYLADFVVNASNPTHAFVYDIGFQLAVIPWYNLDPPLES